MQFAVVIWAGTQPVVIVVSGAKSIDLEIAISYEPRVKNFSRLNWCIE